MATIKQQLRSDLTAAMKSGDTRIVATLRMALAAVAKEEVAGKVARELTDEEVIGVLTAEAKRRREAATAYRDADRQDLAEQEEAEAEVLAPYLPEPLSAADIARLVDEAVAQARADGLSGGRAMGVVMKALKPQTTGRVDGAALAAQVKQALDLG